MKIRLLFLFYCLSFISNAQVTNLSKLSKGKFYSYNTIKDTDNNIKGYFLVFESDKVAKETYEFEYVIMDENLKKVTNGFITEMKFESWLIDAQNIDFGVGRLYKNKLLIYLRDNLKMSSGYLRYRILDISTNTMSDPFIFTQGKMNLHPQFDRKLKNYKFNNSEIINFSKGAGMMVNAVTIDKKEGQNKKYLARFDEDFKETWRYEYYDKETSGKEDKSMSDIDSDSEVMLLLGQYLKNYQDVKKYTFVILDSKTGQVRNEYTIPNEAKEYYRFIESKITADKILVMGTHYEADTKNKGMVRFTFNKADGKLLETKFLPWQDFSGKLDINEKGYVKNEGNLYLHEMLPLDNGKTIVVAEAFEQSPVTTNNMYFFTLDKDFKLEDVFTVEKFRNKFPHTNATSSTIKEQGAFDFIDYQNLGDDEFLFFLSDNEKKTKNRKKSTLYGIVSYSDGQFKRQTINLKTETSTIYIMNAKKGYLVFIENFDEKDKASEFRLEKINY